MTYQALQIEKDDAGYRCTLQTLDDSALPEGDVTVQVDYSTVNYKDGLAITGKSPVVRKFPLTPGIDLAGTVTDSQHPLFKVGDQVVLNGWGVGESHSGGLAQKARLKGDWLVKLPTAFTPRQAMAIGTAGYTAMLCVLALEQHGLKPGAGEVLVLPNAIDPADWRTYRVEGEPDELRISTVMRLAPRKRIIPFLKIIDQAQRALRGYPRLRVAVVGDGPERARAERFVRDHGLEQVVSFLGRLDRAEILEVFANTDLFLQPSVKESFGLAALEARSAGLPIIARSQTGTTQFVRDGAEGLLADSDAGMAQAIMRVARDRALLDRMAAHNQSTPPDDTWPRLLGLVNNAYLAAQSRTPA